MDLVFFPSKQVFMFEYQLENHRCAVGRYMVVNPPSEWIEEQHPTSTRQVLLQYKP